MSLSTTTVDDAVAAALVVCFAAAGAGCDGGRGEDGGAERPRSPGARPAYCPSDAVRYVEGRVRLPVVAEAKGDGSDVGASATGTVRRTRPVSGAQVVVERPKDGGERVEVGAATTDEKGRWCVARPEDVELSTEVVAVVQTEEGRLRRSLVASRGQHVSVRTEALHRILDERGLFESLSRAAYTNLVAAAATATDVFNPPKPSDEGREARIESLRRAMLDEERFRRLLERAKE